MAASGRKGTKSYIPNGPISPDVRLACALHWFAGGSTYNIMMTYSFGHTHTDNCYWYVVDSISKHPGLFYVMNSDDQDKQ